MDFDGYKAASDTLDVVMLSLKLFDTVVAIPFSFVPRSSVEKLISIVSSGFLSALSSE